MSSKRKLMISARMPVDLIERVDFVVRNIDSDTLATRTMVITAAVESWLPKAEKRLCELGVPPPKRK